MSEHNIEKVKSTMVTYEQFSDIDFIPPATFFIRNASGLFHFVHTASREVGQKVIDSVYGIGKYTVNSSRLQKVVSRLESGDFSAYGTSTRRGQKK